MGQKDLQADSNIEMRNENEQQRYVELGAGLKKLRGRKSLQQLADDSEQGDITFSTSTLHRYESGKLLPKLQYAEVIDKLYGARGWVAETIRKEYAPSYNPWTDRSVDGQMYHRYSWPPDYNGLVAVRIWPLEYEVDTVHQLDFVWGPWSYSTAVMLGERGLVFISGKAQSPDNASLHLEISCDKHIFTLFTLGDADHADADLRDIRKDWDWLQQAGDAG